MSERIKQIEEHCYIKPGGYYPGSEWPEPFFDTHKFAELIVQECVATLKEDMELAHSQLIPLDFKMYANGRLQRTIKDHFGIEE